MTIQWTLVAGFLYGEIVVVVLLLLPILSPALWKRLFKSQICQTISERANLYFTVFIIILILFFADSIREIHKYSSSRQQESSHGHLDAELQETMKLFRAQRNFYIAGFALFLWLVIRRLVTLISAHANLLCQSEAAMKQAQSATETAEKLMKEKEKTAKAAGEAAQNEGNIQKEVHEKIVITLKEQLQRTQEELQHYKADLGAMQKQAEAVTREYDHLLRDYGNMQEEMNRVAGKNVNKKEE